MVRGSTLAVGVLVGALMAACGGGGDAPPPANVAAAASAQTIGSSAPSKYDGTWNASFSYPLPQSTGVTVSVSGNTAPSVVEAPQSETAQASAKMSGTTVTFTPTGSATTVTGTIDESGIITIPDRTTECKGIDGQSLVVGSNLSFDSEGRLNGKWYIGAPSQVPGVCYRYLVTATFIRQVNIDPTANIVLIQPSP